jgi:hypothetical protein
MGPLTALITFPLERAFGVVSLSNRDPGERQVREEASLERLAMSQGGRCTPAQETVDG